MNYWHHRINYCRDVAIALLEKNLLAIGFSDIAIQYPKIIIDPPSKIELKSMILYSYQNRYDKTLFVEDKKNDKFIEKSLPQHWVLSNFLYEFKVGDRIVMLNYPTKEQFIIYEIVEQANAIGNLPIKKFIALDGQEVMLQDGLLRWDYIKFIDLGFFIKVKPLTCPIEGTIRGFKSTNSSLNHIGVQLEKIVEENKL